MAVAFSNVTNLQIPEPIILEICACLIDYDKLLFLSCNKYLHKLKQLIWFDSNIKFEKIHTVSYKDRLRSVIIKISDIKYLINQSCKNYYDANKFANLSSLQKLTIVINIRNSTILGDDETNILNKLNIKILIFEKDNKYCISSARNRIMSKLPNCITILKMCEGVICEPKYYPRYLIELKNLECGTILYGHEHLNNFSSDLEKISFLNFSLDESFKSLKKIVFGDDIINPQKIFIPSSVKCIKNIRSLNNISLSTMIKKISFYSDFNNRILVGQLPDNITKLDFNDSFNQMLHPKSLPFNLKHLTFGCDFNQLIDRDVLPDGLEYLKFGYNFDKTLRAATHLQVTANKTISKLKSVVPASVKYMKFGFNFDQSLNGILPINLERLVLGEKFTKSYTFLELLTNLTHLKIHIHSDNNVVIPKNVTHLKIWSHFKYDRLRYISANLKIKKLTIAYCTNDTITKYIPPCVTYLFLSYSDDQEIKLIKNIPLTVQILKIHGSMRSNYKLPQFLTKLKLFDTYPNCELISKNIKKLKISSKYKHLICEQMRRDMYITYYH